MSDGLPKFWEIVKLGEICELIRGLAFPTADKSFAPSEGNIACLRTTNVQREVEWQDLWFIPTKHVRHERQLVRIGDILISTANSFELVGKVAQIKILPYPATLGAFISLIRPSDQLNKSFLFYQLTTLAVQSEIRSMASTTTNISNVSTSKLRELKVDVAPVEEQLRIVAEIEKQFTRLDTATAALKRVQANLKRYRASVLKAACEGRLVPTEAELSRKEGRDYEPADMLLQRILRERRTRWEADTLAKMIASNRPPKDASWKQKYKEPSAPDTANLPPLPEGWCWIRMGHAFDCIVPNRDKPKSLTGDIPWLTLPDFGVEIDIQKSKNERGLSQGEVERYNARLIPAGSVVMSCVGRFGVTAVLKCVAVINQQLHAFILPEWLPGQFYAYALRTQTNYMESLSTATTIAYLNKDNCNSVPVPMPPALEQGRIYQELDRQMSVVAELEKQAERSLKLVRNLRQSILKHAFSGNLIPQDPNDEPASVLLERIRAERSSADPKKSIRHNSREHAHA